MSIFYVDADIRKAKTIPADFYTDERYFEMSRDKIFVRTWQFLGTDGDVAGLKPVTMLRGVLEEPVLLARNADGLACLSNVCTHRGKILVEEPCAAVNLIRCRYHGRRFSLDGKFLSMPEFEGVEDFPGKNDDLTRVPFASRDGFLFASVDPIAAFEVFAEGFPDVDFQGLKLTATREYEVKAHWALDRENYLEGFHIPYVHKALNEVVDYGTYATETFRFSSVQTAFDDSGNIAARYLFIFPNTMFNFYPWGISVNVVRPVTHDKTVVEFLTYVRDAAMDGGAGGDLHGVEMEDEAVVESVQRGVRSRFYSHGRYSPKRETGTHHFHRLIAEFMK